jgi:hypothetical protein
MRSVHWIIATALIGTPALAAAQDQTTTKTTAPQTTTTTTTTQTNTTESTWYHSGSSHWMLSGFVGSNFGAAATDASVDFGGQIGYLWGGALGAEFIADFAPNFKINNTFLANSPEVNSYMVNAVAAIPIGREVRFQPYLSGGLGGIQLRSDVLSSISGPAGGANFTSDQTRFGGDIGAGVMGFAGPVGLRADVRYYRAFSRDVLSTDTNSPADALSQNLLSGLDFWRANIGVAFRW